MRDFLNANMHYAKDWRSENVRELNTTRMLQLDNKEEILLEERLKMYTAIPRKVVAKLQATIRKENTGYDQDTVPD